MKLTNDEIDAKVAELSNQFGGLVTPLVYDIDEDTQVVGYLKKPTFLQKSYAFDKVAMKEMTDAGDYLLTACLIKEESNEAFINNDDIRLSAVMSCIGLIKVYENSFKKK